MSTEISKPKKFTQLTVTVDQLVQENVMIIEANFWLILGIRTFIPGIKHILGISLDNKRVNDFYLEDRKYVTIVGENILETK